MSLSTAETGSAVRRRSGRLLAERRQALEPNDGHVEGHTHTDANGDKIHRVEYEDKDTGTETVDTNLSKLLAAAPSTTASIDLIRSEAELVAEGAELENPHVPSNDDVLDQVLAVLQDDGLTPAWEVMNE